jgi:hypothetical protein
MLPRPIVTLIGAVAALAVGCSASPFAPSARGKRASAYGIVTQTWSGEHARWTADLGAGWIRLDFNWFELQPARDKFDWGVLDGRLAAAAAQGLRVYATLAYTPEWAGPCRHCTPDDLTDWRLFVEAVLDRYRGRGIVFGIWNEPNLGFLNDTPDGARYADLFAAAHAARLRVDRAAVLAGPETSHHAWPDYFGSVAPRVLWHMLPSDVVSVHFYPDAPFDLATYMAHVSDAARGHQLWLTETGMSTCDEDRQSRYIADVLDTFERLGRSWWPRLFLYVLHNGEECTEALVRPGGQYRPAFETYRTFIAAHPL